MIGLAVRVVGLVAVTTGAGGVALHAQAPPPTPPDSMRRFSLGEIVVAASAAAPAPASHTLTRVSIADIRRQNAAVVADLARLIPAAHVQTNSRGETLIYLRNAGERQVGVFFEGALLNVPWDNRVDLSLVPATVMGGVTVAKGVPPVEYGTNVIGGAVNLTARMSETDRSETEIQGLAGSQGRWQGSLTHRGQAGRLSYAASASYAVSDGFALSDGAPLPFSQTDTDLRTNTDSRVTNLFASGVHHFDNGNRLGVTVLHLDARKGIAPEGHLDPTQSRVRYWRYPDWRHSTGIVTAAGATGETVWRGSGWVTAFDQIIDSYGSDAYDRLDGRQDDDDLTFGTRFTLARPLGSGTAKVSFNGLTSRHTQAEETFDGAGASTGIGPELGFRQHLLSVGSEYRVFATTNLEVTVGASVDAMFAPETGDKPSRDPFVDYSATAGFTYDPMGTWFVRAAVGRKTRFPSMRELFGEALNRFLLNDSLDPESSLLTEVALGLRGERISGEVIPFATFTNNTIDQRSVTLPGETRARRQRINLKGSRVLGVELVGTARLRTDFRVDAHLTLSDVHRRQDAPTDATRLSEKPSVLARLSAGYEGTQGLSVDVETVYTGRAYSLDDNDVFVPLNTSLVFNARVARSFVITPRRAIEVFARADNLTDQLVLPQLGLPAPGRSVAAGMTVAF